MPTEDTPHPWQEYIIEGKMKWHIVAVPTKGVRLRYLKRKLRVYVDWDLFPSKYQITEQGRIAVWKLYQKVANKKSHMIYSPRSGLMKIPKEKLEYAIIQVIQILTEHIEDDTKLGKMLTMKHKEHQAFTHIKETEEKTKKQICTGGIYGSTIFEQIKTGTDTYKYQLYQQMEDNTWELSTAPTYEHFIPMPRSPLSHPSKALEYQNDKQLYENVKSYIFKHLDLLNPLGYDVLTAFVFNTWIPELFDFTAYLGFFGRESVGKTRALEILNQLCLRSWFTTGLTIATLFRLVQRFNPPLLLDEAEFLNTQDRKELISLLNAGQRRGITIPRMTGERFDKVEFFNVYSPKVISGTEQLKRTTTSRMVTFVMTRNIRKVPRYVAKKEGLQLRNQLLLWRFQTLAKMKDSASFKEKVSSTFELKATAEYPELDGLSGRSFELFYPLYHAAPTGKKNILQFALELEKLKLSQEKTALNSIIFEAILNLQNQAKRGVLLIKQINMYINANNEPQNWIPSKTIVRKCEQMGFPKTRVSKGIGIFILPKIIERLKKDPRYTTDLLNWADEGNNGEKEILQLKERENTEKV